MTGSSQIVTVGVLAAYRAELKRRGTATALGVADSTWIVIGSLFEEAARSAPSQRSEILMRAGEAVRAAVPTRAWAVDTSGHTQRDAILSSLVRDLSEHLEDNGALALADAILEAYLRADEGMTPLERARCICLRARFAWAQGNHILAQSYYENVEQVGRRLQSAELRTRASIGYAIVARLRGNFPASRLAGQHAARLARRHRLTHLTALAHQTLMIAAVAAGDMDEAVEHAWKAYENVRGDAIAEGIRLVDLAQLFYDRGHASIADAGFRAALERSLPARVRLPALGGAALVAAQLGRNSEVHRITDAVRSLGETVTLPYVTAGSWLDAAEACYRIGANERGEALRLAAEQTAGAHAYHELLHRAQILTQNLAALTAPRPTGLSEKSAAIADAICELAQAGC